MSTRRFAQLFLVAGLWACADGPTSLPLSGPLLAKGGTVTQRADFTISDAGMSLVSDGKGTYTDGVCGVVGTSTTDITHLAPAGASVPKAQKASCTGIAPRAATLTLAVRHLSDDPHVDDAQSPVGSGAFPVQNVKFGWGAALATTINASPACGTVGLRFTPVTYPGTDNVLREGLGGGLWRMRTSPFPNNRAYCEVNGVPSYWHVDLDIRVQIHG